MLPDFCFTDSLLWKNAPQSRWTPDFCINSFQRPCLPVVKDGLMEEGGPIEFDNVASYKLLFGAVHRWWIPKMPGFSFKKSKIPNKHGWWLGVAPRSLHLGFFPPSHGADDPAVPCWGRKQNLRARNGQRNGLSTLAPWNGSRDILGYMTYIYICDAPKPEVSWFIGILK